MSRRCLKRTCTVCYSAICGRLMRTPLQHPVRPGSHVSVDDELEVRPAVAVLVEIEAGGV